MPEFNWGGMENVAAIGYTDTVIFRDPPTEDQLTRRAEYLTHELAHMWFGDLVTMRWWNDLWLNESFASYVAYLALDHMGGFPAIWLDFHTRMKMWAYREDQRPTTHRIADEIASTDETFLNFDGITYGKGAAVLKQLVAAIGPDAFRTGLQDYFRRHRFGNASLADFLAALQEGSGVDLVHWAARWLRTASLNTLAAEWQAEGIAPDPPRPGADRSGRVPGAAAPPRRGGPGRGRRQAQGAGRHHRRRAQPAERRRRPGRPGLRVPQLQRLRLRQGRPRPGVHGLGAGQSGAHRLAAACASRCGGRCGRWCATGCSPRPTTWNWCAAPAGPRRRWPSWS